jgi:hypothetical protein
VYLSQSEQEIGMLGLMNLLDISANKNQDNHVTGVLLFDKGTFGQILEGRACFLAPIWQSITVDKRHKNIEVLDFKKINDRAFRNWSMAFYGSEQISKYVPELRMIFNGLQNTLHPKITQLISAISRDVASESQA